MATASTPPAAADDWTRVDAGTYHGFHQVFVGQIGLALNKGLLPEGYYGHVERNYGAVTASENESDILTLDIAGRGFEGGGGTAVLEAPPAVAEETEIAAAAMSESDWYATRSSRLAIKRNVDHRVVAVLEVSSPGNKDREWSVDRFLTKLTEALEDGVHVVLVDLFPPGPADPGGLHAELLRRMETAHAPPPDQPLCAAGYRSGPVKRAYAQPFAVGDPLPTVPLFLTPDRYIDLPLGPSYAAAKPVIGFWWEEVLRGDREPPGREEPRP